MTIEPSWPVAFALAALLVLALGAHRVGAYGLDRSVLVAAVRALAQLTLIALIIRAVVENLWASAALVVVMLATAVLTSAYRIEAPGAWVWAAVAVCSGAVPVLAIVLLSGAVPAEGIALIPIAGIIVGNAMTALTLSGRRTLAALREENAQYEASLSLGLLPRQAIGEIIHRRAPEALLPGLDQVRTTGLVTLPGAFVGVMLGGGSPVQAATVQMLVLFGIMAAQAITVVVAERLVEARRLVSADLRVSLVD